MNSTTLRIQGRLVGTGQRTFIIAEIGVNHDGSVERAVELVHHAAAAGADAIKLQVFTASNLVHSSASFADYQKSRVSESDPAAMLRKYELSSDALRSVVATARELSLAAIATPFSLADVSVIESMDLPAVKIASPDLVNRLLLERVAKTRLPMIVSTGAATMDEVAATTHWLRAWHAGFALLHCVSSYPTPASQAHLGWIEELSKFGVPVGYSDHTTELFAGAFAVSAGACIIEKHLTYDRGAQGPDHSASADPTEFAEYVRLIRKADALRGGTVAKHVLPVENDVRTVSRQSLVLSRDVAKGQAIGADDLTVQRPGTGISPAHVGQIIGRTLRADGVRGTMLDWGMLDESESRISVAEAA